MKGWILATTAGALLMSAMTVSAAPHGPDRDVSREAIYQSWSLSAQQQDQLKNADDSFHERMTTLSDQDFDSAGARHQAMNDAVQAHRQALAAILDKDQIRVLEGLDQRVAPMRAKGQLMKALFDSWKLDDSQRQSIDQSRQQMREDLKALRDDNTAPDSRDKRRQAMDEIRQQQQERLARVLDPEQIQVLEMIRHVELRGPRGKPPVDVARALITSWHLDQDKMAALKEARHDLQEQLAPLKGQSGVTDEDRHQLMDQAMTQFHQQLEDILNSAQIAALDSVSAPHGDRMGPPLHGMDKHSPMKHQPDHDQPRD